MKKLYTIFAMVMINAVAKAQGTNCNNAINLTPTNNLTYLTHTSNGKEYWAKFTAQSENVNLSVKTKPYGNNQEHAHEATLYDGACGNLTEIKKDELSFVNYADELSIDMNATGLIPGNTYYLKIDREAHIAPCDKTNCTANNSANPATFDLAVQNISVLIPLDFGLEQIPVALTYEQNRGQLLKTDGTYASEIKIYNEKLYPSTYISDNKTSFVWAKIDTDATTIDTMHRVDMFLENANQNPQIFRTENNPSQTNYYLAHTPKGVHNKESYGRPVVKKVYNNIDMQFSANEKGIKMFFTVHPGGNADDIIMRFDGATAVNVTNDSSRLEITTPLGILDFEAGHAYQINPGNQIVPMPWQAKFIKTAFNKVKLDIRNYAQNMPLFIQIDRGHTAAAAASSPKWCTFFGGTDEDYANDITVDTAGAVYIIGTTKSSKTSFPVTSGAFQGVLVDYKDAFAAKFDFNYKREWATYYGGNQDDVGNGITYSRFDDKIYIAGVANSTITSLDIFALAGSPNSFVDNSTGSVGFIARLTSDQGFRVWATRFGGYSTACNKIKADNAGNIYVVGQTGNTVPELTCGDPPGGKFPICNPGGGAYVQGQHGGGNAFFQDGFIAKFNSATELIWCTYYGGNGDGDDIRSIAIDNTNSQIYITGSTDSPLITPLPACGTPPTPGSFPLCDGAGGYYQDAINADNNFAPVNGPDAFIARFTSSGIMEWSSFFGGFSNDYGTDVAVNSLGQVYITGTTQTTTYTDPCNPPFDGNITAEGFPNCQSGVNDYFQDFGNGGSNNGSSENWDAFIAKFDYPEPILLWSTFIGGDRAEGIESAMFVRIPGPGIAIDYNDRVHISGTTHSGSYVGDTKIPLINNNNYYYQGVNADENFNINNSVREGFVASFNSDDSPFLGTFFGGKENDKSTAIAVFLDRIYITGGSTSTSQFPLSCPTDVPNPYCQGYTTVTASKHDAFIAQIRSSGFPVSTPPIDKPDFSASVFPNPSNGKFTIENLPVFSSQVSLTVYDALGQKVFEKDIFSNNKQINLPALSNGLYFIKINSGKNTFNSKILIQR